MNIDIQTRMWFTLYKTIYLQKKLLWNLLSFMSKKEKRKTIL
jgi:hypothetical protein